MIDVSGMWRLDILKLETQESGFVLSLHVGRPVHFHSFDILLLFYVQSRGEARAKPRGVRHFTTKFEDLYILAKSVVAVTSKWSYRYYRLFFCREFCLRVLNFSQYFSPILEQSIKIFLALFVISLEFR